MEISVEVNTWRKELVINAEINFDVIDVIDILNTVFVLHCLLIAVILCFQVHLTVAKSAKRLNTQI